MQDELSDRLLEFASKIIRLTMQINKNPIGQHIGRQIMRSATSAGANYEEACAGESRADFIHKLQITLKELRESLYWLRLIKKSNLKKVDSLIDEAKELTNIIAKSILTAKKK
ncbi:MAG: four helix bundle protein [Caldiserica bacterium]|nr:MAG: four helix bundle protein [Caldisericota bacterium]